MFDPSAEFRIRHAEVPFIPTRCFVAGTEPGREIRIATIFDEFRRRFLSNPRWTLEPHSEVSIRVLRLTTSSTSTEILERFSEVPGPEVPLSVVFQILKRQPAGESGPLSTTGFTNVFFVRDSTDCLQAVRVHWFGYGWHLGSYPVTRVIPWREGAHIVTRLDADPTPTTG